VIEIGSGFCSSISGEAGSGSGISASGDSYSMTFVSWEDSHVSWEGSHVSWEDSHVSGGGSHVSGRCDTEMESWTWARGDSGTRTWASCWGHTGRSFLTSWIDAGFL